jgi:hypothetical protein
MIRFAITAALAGLLALVPSSPPGSNVTPTWASSRSHRIIVEVPAVDISKRLRDEAPAEVAVDFEALLRRDKISGSADLSTLQVMRFDPGTGKPIPYTNNLYQDTPYDLPLQWHDAAIPDPFPDRDRSVKSPWIARRNWGYYYEVNGDWKKGKLAWTHVQQGRTSSWYAVYFNLLPEGGKQRAPAPRGWIGDGSHRTAPVGTRSLGLYIPDCQMVDYNGDGLPDLLCGTSRGAVLWYENLGTKQKPHFAIARLLFQSDGRAIDPGFLSTPALTDWDRDGKPDLIMGAAKGWVYFYKNVGTREKPLYEDRGPVQLNGIDLRPPASPVPEVAGPNGESIYEQDYEPFAEIVDWDGDGEDDLLLGGYVTGRVFWYRTKSRDSNGVPTLEDMGPLMADGKTLDVGWAASPTAADLDGDGDLDLIVGNWRKWGNESPPELGEEFLSYFENVGSRTQPVLTQKALPRVGKFPGDIASPSLADWNGDGKVDLTVATQGGNLYLIENIGTAKAPKFDARRLMPLALPWGNDPFPRGGDSAPLMFVRSGAGQVALEQGYFRSLSKSPAIPWKFGPLRSLLPEGQEIDHRSWRGDDWIYTQHVDFDGDGRKDLLFGDYWGNVWFHKNNSTQSETLYDTRGVRITAEDGKLLLVGPTKAKAYDFDTMQGPRTGVIAADFDGDRTVDLVLSDVYGHYYSCPRGPHGKVPKVKTQILIGELKRYGDNYAVDYDNDGRLDLLVSQSEKHYLFRNVGAGKGIGGSVFGSPELVEMPVIPVIGGTGQVAFLDANRDGDRDLILSSDHGYDCFFEDTFLRRGYIPGKLIRLEVRKN